MCILYVVVYLFPEVLLKSSSDLMAVVSVCLVVLCVRSCVLPVSRVCVALCVLPKLLCMHVVTAFAASARHLLSLSKAFLTLTYFYTFSVVFMIITMGILKMLMKDYIDE